MVRGWREAVMQGIELVGHGETTKTAQDFMVTKLVTLEPAAPVLHSIHKLIHLNVKGAPVVDSDQSYLGIFTERCCLRALSSASDQLGSAAHAARTLSSGDLMTKQLWMLQPDMDAFDAVTFLLAHRISGAPVVDEQGRFLGVFSESLSMKVLIDALYDNLPGAHVRDYMELDSGRLISDYLGFSEVVGMFLRTPYRRLVVVRDERVVGQISRHNVLVNSHAMVRSLSKRPEVSGPSWTVSAFMDTDARTIDESLSMFSVATIFRETTLRRLPVLRDKLLVGQITRKNLLNAANEILNRPTAKTAQPLYLPSVPDATPPGM